MSDRIVATPKAQPVMLLIRSGERLECQCGSIAIWVLIETTAPSGSPVIAYCQPCMDAMQLELLRQQFGEGG